MKLKQSLLVAIFLGLGMLTIWEIYVRSQGYLSEMDDNKALWAIQRSQVPNLTSNDVVIIGSSRVHYDLQLDVWEDLTGRRPLQLASDGTTPTPVFKDLVEQTSFNGTIIIGVAPGLFFSTPGEGFMWRRPSVRLQHFYDRTYAQRANHYLSVPLENSLAFLNASEEEWSDDIDLKTLVNNITIGERVPEGYPPFNNFGFVDKYRNVTMFEKTKNDTAFANGIIKVWNSGNDRRSKPELDSVVNFYQELLPKFNERGGKVIFLRCPSNGGVRKSENEKIPKEQFWDELIKQTQQPGYHFEDYEALNQFVCPEESHLYTPDAKLFTHEFVQLLLKDNHLTKSN